MKSSKAILFCLMTLVCLQSAAAPNFFVRHDGRSLLIDLKHKVLANRVIETMKNFHSGSATIIVNTETGTFVQLYNFFEEGFNGEKEYLVSLEQYLEEQIAGQAREYFVRVIPRIPYAPSREEIDSRRAAHVDKMIRMGRDPHAFGPQDVTEILSEHFEIPILEAQHKAVHERLHPQQDPTPKDIEEMVAQLNEISEFQRAMRRELHARHLQAVFQIVGITSQINF